MATVVAEHELTMQSSRTKTKVVAGTGGRASSSEGSDPGPKAVRLARSACRRAAARHKDEQIVRLKTLVTEQTLELDAAEGHLPPGTSGLSLFERLRALEQRLGDMAELVSRVTRLEDLAEKNDEYTSWMGGSEFMPLAVPASSRSLRELVSEPEQEQVHGAPELALSVQYPQLVQPTEVDDELMERMLVPICEQVVEVFEFSGILSPVKPSKNSARTDPEQSVASLDVAGSCMEDPICELPSKISGDMALEKSIVSLDAGELSGFAKAKKITEAEAGKAAKAKDQAAEATQKGAEALKKAAGAEQKAEAEAKKIAEAEAKEAAEAKDKAAVAKEKAAVAKEKVAATKRNGKGRGFLSSKESPAKESAMAEGSLPVGTHGSLGQIPRVKKSRLCPASGQDSWVKSSRRCLAAVTQDPGVKNISPANIDAHG